MLLCTSLQVQDKCNIEHRTKLGVVDLVELCILPGFKPVRVRRKCSVLFIAKWAAIQRKDGEDFWPAFHALSDQHRRESERDRLIGKLVSDQQVVEVPRTLRVERENRIAACLSVRSGM